MFTDPMILIDETLQRLDLLSALFDDEVDERIRHAGEQEPSVRLCREVNAKINELIPKLRAAKVTQQPTYQTRVCLHCDD
jgi:hypothetical protein